MLDTFFRTHRYLIEHTQAPVQRALMNEIDWHHRLIGIKGSRGVGKTTFLLQYAKKHFGVNDYRCLYVNMNHFYFQGHTITSFAGEASLKSNSPNSSNTLLPIPVTASSSTLNLSP